MSRQISVTRLSKRTSGINGTGIRSEHKKDDRAAVLRGNAEHESFDREVRYFFSDKSVRSKALVHNHMRVVMALCFVAMLALVMFL